MNAEHELWRERERRTNVTQQVLKFFQHPRPQSLHCTMGRPGRSRYTVGRWAVPAGRDIITSADIKKLTPTAGDAYRKMAEVKK